MRKLSFQFELLLFVGFVFSVSAFAQDKTIILVRHGEKDTAATADKKDPELAESGKERAKKLVTATKRYKFDEIYSTDFKRTRGTAEPTATKRKKTIQTYDASKPQELVDKIMASKNDRFLVIGHSNTVPQLANLIGKRMVFRDLLDTEFSVIWVVKMKKGVVEKFEILSY